MEPDHRQTRPPPRSYTADEYLRFDEASPTKHEFRHGEIIAMSGASYDHVRIASNVQVGLNVRMSGGPCTALGSDLRVRIGRTVHYCYPDVSVVCGEPAFHPPDRRVTITNPQVVIEVLSRSTESVDRSDKFDDYMRVDSLQEYILFSQDRSRVDTFFRQADGMWGIGPSSVGLDASVQLRSLGVALPLVEVYAGVVFPPTSKSDSVDE